MVYHSVVYQSLTKYISEMFNEYKPCRSLRSAGAGELEVPGSENKQDEMAFSHYAAYCWNQLPMEIRYAPTVTSFKKKLK